MALILRRFASAADFAAHATPYLLAHEAAHCLPLGITASLRHAAPDAAAPYLATVDAPGGVVAVALRTPPHNLVLSRVADPAALDLLAADLHREYGALPGVHGPTGAARDFAVIWQRVAGQDGELAMTQRIYRLDRVRPVVGVPGELRPVAPADIPLVTAWIASFVDEAEGGSAAERAEEIVAERLAGPDGGLALWWHADRAVSLVGHGGPTPNGIRIGPVYTPPALRGQGYASAAVASLSQRLLDAGQRFCCLFTDLATPTSNRLYQHLGYEPVGDAALYHFSP